MEGKELVHFVTSWGKDLIQKSHRSRIFGVGGCLFS